ncbi:hypothetical protein GALL_257070 [mine drainage metagenome]|jgi:outer membrane lipoprotein SlyB|uniref:Glycine zipper 2TM domain-containing protein n=1 Tax=mine drainage metagenome TaxID=410659 RepID=A0A1J5RW39_9ZZZZ
MNPSPAAIPKAVWIAAAAFASAIVILLGAVLYKLNHPGVPAPAASAASAAAAASAPTARAASAASTTSAPAVRRGERRTERRRIEPQRNERPAAVTRNDAPAAQPAPPPCRDCGTVIAVAPERVEGQANGAGAVIGGVLGGILGHQVGGGNGQTAATVLGAIGGGLAGNEVQKRVNAHTVYRVEIRMDDGSARSVTMADAPPVGTHVRIGADGSLQAAP